MKNLNIALILLFFSVNIFASTKYDCKNIQGANPPPENNTVLELSTKLFSKNLSAVHIEYTTISLAGRSFEPAKNIFNTELASKHAVDPNEMLLGSQLNFKILMADKFMTGVRLYLSDSLLKNENSGYALFEKYSTNLIDNTSSHHYYKCTKQQ